MAFNGAFDPARGSCRDQDTWRVVQAAGGRVIQAACFATHAA